MPPPPDGNRLVVVGGGGLRAPVAWRALSRGRGLPILGSGRPDLILSNRHSLPFHHHISHGPFCGSDHVPFILKVSSNPISIPSPPASTTAPQTGKI
ncbi:hypothetical protein E2C01_054925 [Portunus trituberculatus]|uniref:Uncharacterized protein n=1 Tax=Portunus trituberculatus TaxID=210409 RepID=A0A5B7GTH2_PORTR|nr:hypothetical protein [Portunus trituberculatus]